MTDAGIDAAADAGPAFPSDLRHVTGTVSHTWHLVRQAGSDEQENPRRKGPGALRTGAGVGFGT